LPKWKHNLAADYFARGPSLLFQDAGSGGNHIACNAVLHYYSIWSRRIQIMTTLTVTARGQVTFRKDVLQHLGIRPGERIELNKLPDGRVSLKAMRPSGKIDSFLGLLAGKTKKVATMDEINEAAASGWAGQK
jgi:bifunctional DNA-binding transcriptional regulator/antitoxin component of YhaV-PrlF toxin-antitoxin module